MNVALYGEDPAGATSARISELPGGGGRLPGFIWIEAVLA